jgi:hypothetical protein
MILSLIRMLPALPGHASLLLALLPYLSIHRAGAQEPQKVLEPVLQEIRPGYQSVVGTKYTCINRGEFIDIYDNQSRTLFRSVPVFVDQGAEKGTAFTFTLSNDERLIQTKAWIKYIGERTTTFEISSGREVGNVKIAGRSSNGSMNDFNVAPSHIPIMVEPRKIAHFQEAPSLFLNPGSFFMTELSSKNTPRRVKVDLIRGDREEPGLVDTLIRFQKSASSNVDFHNNKNAVIRSFSVNELRRIATQRKIGGAKNLPASSGDTMQVLCAVDGKGAPRFVTSSIFEEGRHQVRDLVLRHDGRACAIAWDVYPGKPSELYGTEVRFMENGAMIFRDEWLYAECLSFGRGRDDLYMVGRFGHRQGPLSGIKGLVLARLRMTSKGAEVLWHTPVETMQDISVDPDGSRVYAVSADGRLHLFNAATGRKMIEATGFEENGLLLRTPDHFFMATGGAEQALALRDQKSAYPLEQFDLHFNRPQNVLKILGAPQTLIKEATLSYQDRLALHGLSGTLFRSVDELPKLEASVKSVSGKKMTLNINARARAGELVSVSAWVNNVPVLGRAGSHIKGKTISAEVAIPLLEGRNKIQISVVDSLGQESIKETILYNSSHPVPLKTARILAIGISDYPGEKADLNYAAKDARDLIKTLAASMSAEYQVQTKLLVDQAATKKGILAAKNFFREGKPDDVAVVFLAGHGALSPKTARYYFCPGDMDFSDPAKNGLTYPEIEFLLSDIPSMRRLIMIDSCHSGELTMTEIRAAAAAAKSQVEGTGRTIKSLRPITGTRVGQNETNSTLSKSETVYGFRDMRRQIGAQVLAASGPLEVALEGKGWANGVFTYHILTGLQNKQADQNGDGALTVTELFESVAEKVYKITGGTQRPRFRHTNQAFDFPLVGNMARKTLPKLTDATPGPGPKSRLAQPGRRHPHLSRKMITRNEAKAMSLAQIRYAINELYAIHGYPFESSGNVEIRKHFSQFDWFKPEAGLKMSTVDSRMSAIERKNIEILAEARNKKR